nr:DUF554 domain-containing protein [Treponema sp.]
NVFSVVLGGIIGTFFSSRISKDFTGKLNIVFGICAMGMGISSIGLMQNMSAVILAVILGSIFGFLIKLGDKISSSAAPLARLFPVPDGISKDEFQSLLITALVLFCSSGTGIYGSLDAGMTGDPSILISKSILDLFTAVIFACTLGLTTAAIAIPQAVIFFALFALAKLIVPHTNASMIGDFKACGGFLLVATGLRMSKIKEFPIADMLPAMALVMPISYLWTSYIVPLL